MVIPNMRSYKPLLAVLLVVLAISGAACAPAYVETGPNPAQIQVEVSAVTNDAEIERAGRRYGLQGLLTVFGVWRELRGPFWSWGLYLVKEDGSLWDLKPLGAGPDSNFDGYALDRKVTFLIPPGQHQVRLLVQSHMELRTEHIGGESEYDVIPVSTYSEDFLVDLHNGEQKFIKRGFGEPGRTNTIRRDY